MHYGHYIIGLETTHVTNINGHIWIESTAIVRYHPSICHIHFVLCLLNATNCKIEFRKAPNNKNKKLYNGHIILTVCSTRIESWLSAIERALYWNHCHGHYNCGRGMGAM